MLVFFFFPQLNSGLFSAKASSISWLVTQQDAGPLRICGQGKGRSQWPVPPGPEHAAGQGGWCEKALSAKQTTTGVTPPSTGSTPQHSAQGRAGAWSEEEEEKEDGRSPCKVVPGPDSVFVKEGGGQRTW